MRPARSANVEHPHSFRIREPALDKRDAFGFEQPSFGRQRAPGPLALEPAQTEIGGYNTMARHPGRKRIAPHISIGIMF